MRTWFSDPSYGIAVVCGRVSGGLEVLDFEDQQAYREWIALVECLDCVTLLPLVRTPRGVHVYFRSDACQSGRRLATVDDESRGHDGLLVETRGEGQYVITAPSPAPCHPLRCPWQHMGGPPVEATPRISVAERDTLLGMAEILGGHREASDDELKKAMSPDRPDDAFRPGDHFEMYGPAWSEILEPHGWKLARRDGEVEFWKRPGETTSAWSATAGYCRGPRGEPLLYVFSTNAGPLDPGPYGRFRALAALEHAGDFRACARALRAEGYGGHPRKSSAHSNKRELPSVEGPQGLMIRIVEMPRRTAEKLVVRVDVTGLGQPLRGLTLTSTAHGLESAANEIVELLPLVPDRQTARSQKRDVKRALRNVLSTAEELSKEADQRPTLLVILQNATERLRLAFKYNGRVWSEAGQGRWLMFRDYKEALITPAVLNELLECSDLDKPDPVLATIRGERLASVLWAQLLEELPYETEAGLGPDSAAARRWRERIVETWTVCETWFRESEGHACRTSLAARGSQLRDNHGSWHLAHPGLPAWLRWSEGALEFAMRAELIDRRRLDGVTDHRAWGQLMEQYGLVGDVVRVGAKRTSVRGVVADVCRQIQEVARVEPFLDGHLGHEDED